MGHVFCPIDQEWVSSAVNSSKLPADLNYPGSWSSKLFSVAADIAKLEQFNLKFLAQLVSSPGCVVLESFNWYMADISD